MGARCFHNESGSVRQPDGAHWRCRNCGARWLEPNEQLAAGRAFAERVRHAGWPLAINQVRRLRVWEVERATMDGAADPDDKELLDWLIARSTNFVDECLAEVAEETSFTQAHLRNLLADDPRDLVRRFGWA